MMKNLGQYNIFDFESFSKGKAFEVVNCSPWVERATSKLLGTVVEVVIIKDETNYGEGKGKGLNKYEKLKFKTTNSVSITSGKIVTPINPVAKIYGEYRNQLSVTCDDIKVVESKVTK